jgi:uncharacterized membrane protein YfcA
MQSAALFIWMNSLAGLCGAMLSGESELELGTLLPFAGSVLIGGLVGSRYGAKIAPQNMVRKILVVVLLIAVIKQVIDFLV